MKTVIDSASSSTFSLAEIVRYRGLFWNLSMRDVLVRYKQTSIGVLWAIVRPAIHIAIFVFFSQFIEGGTDLNARIVNVGAGIIIWTLISTSVTTRDIESHMKEIYGLTFSEASISNITDKIIDHIEAFKTRRLDPLYYIVWMDAIVFKVRQDGKVIDKAVQIAVGLNEHGKKEVLGMWLCQNESAAFWMQVLTTLKARGVQDILITATDNLKGFTEAITSVFPLALTQVCIVHQLRNSLKFVVWKDKKAVVSALQAIYNAPNRESAYRYLETFDQSWSKKYPYIAKSWMANWDNLTTFFEFPAEIRKIMYTTNIIENLNRLIRKYTKTKSMLPNDQAVEKVVYLALMQASKKWTMPARNWPLMLTQFINKFGEERCNLKIYQPFTQLFEHYHFSTLFV